MRKFTLIIIINLLSLLGLIAQSKTLEVTPEFFKDGEEFSTKEISVNLSDQKLDFIALSCYHYDKEENTIYYRLKINNQWSQWAMFNRQHEYVASDRKAYQAKAIHESFSDIQIKTLKALTTPLSLRFFLAPEDSSSTPTITRSINCESPEVCERDCWCPTCPVDNTPQFTDPTHLIVHHSAGNNQSNNFAAVIESIWDLHVNTNGWDDIGYNWLIDPNGILYQGRLDDYQGAHFSCINENTVGICLIGDYSLVEPSAESLSTLVNLLAFESTEHEIDVTGESYHVTGDFVLDNIAGHRDSSGSENACSGTACPGDSFYPLLPELRLQVAELPCYNSENTSIKENDISKIKVYPNPMQDHLIIESNNDEKLSLEIIDLNGKSLGFVSSDKLNNISHLNSGVYFLIYKDQWIQKMIKK